MKLFPMIGRLAIFFSVVLVSCNKQDPEPSLGDQIAGEYTGTYYTVGGTTRVNLPATNSAGVTATVKISLTKVNDASANVKVTFSATDKTGKVVDAFNNYDGLTLKKATTGEIEGYLGSTKHVSWVNGEVGVTVPDPTPTKTVVFYGKKN
ncbi:MAG: hypothetical protein U0X91_07960 [Spirosomataceae bacterium]